MAYQRRLDALLAAMQADTVRRIKAQYRRKPPEVAVAADESPAMALRELMARLARDWQTRFDKLAEDLARHFAQDVSKRSDAALRTLLRKAGFTVRFTMTRAQNDILQAVTGENVALIKSIPEKYMTDVQGYVLRSVSLGRDLGALSRDLQHNYGVAKRRAAFIARDQNNKATAALQRGRYEELGIKEAIWVHSGAGKHPRPEHVAMSGKKYDVQKGAYLEGKWTWPGHEPNCRCVSRPIIPGLS